MSDHQIENGPPYILGEDLILGPRYSLNDMWADMGIDPAAESYIALQIGSDGTRKELLVKGGVLISERVVPEDEGTGQ